MLDELTEIMKLQKKPQLAHRLDRYNENLCTWCKKQNIVLRKCKERELLETFPEE